MSTNIAPSWKAFVEDITSAIKQISKILNKNPSEVTFHEFQKNVALDNEMKRGLSKLGGFNAIRDAHFKPKIYTEKLVIEAQAKEARAEAKQEARDDLFINRLASAVEKNLKVLPPPEKLPEKKKHLKRHQHLLISDTHFGSDLNPERGVRAYGVVEEARSLAKIVLEACEYKPQYREDTKLFVNLNGDMIQGKIHDKQSGDDISQQVTRAIHVLEQGIAILASNFPEVEVNCAVGNHDRIPDRHEGREASGKNDSHAYIIYYALMKIFKHWKNVKFNLPLTPYVTYQTFDANYYGTHGDTHIRLPSLSGGINARDLENQINRLNSRMNGPKYNLVFCGHIHSGMILHLSNGVVLVTNPPLMPTDEFGLSLNLDPDGPTGQWLWESVEGHAMGDSRFLKVTEADRQDSKLDKVIIPYNK